jgi:hypothetical protein
MYNLQIKHKEVSMQHKDKSYIVMIGGAPMGSIDALLLSLERFHNMLSSDSAREQFETVLRSLQPDLKSVHEFIDAAYSRKDPRYAVGSKNRTLVVEVNLNKPDFFNCVHDQDITEILSHVTAVGSMPSNKTPGQKSRDYTVFPVRYQNGRFVKLA